jgi:hypothetical protein
MEHYSSDPRPSLEKCLADVRECPVYLGIFARRYGWIPPGTERSITEQEYRQAVHSEKEILIFLLNDEAPGWKEPNDELPAKQARLATLREELSTRHLAARFSNCNDLELEVIAALANAGKAPMTPLDVEREDNLLQLVAAKDRTTRDRAARGLVEMGSAAYAARLRARLKRGHARRLRSRQDDVRELAQIESMNHRVMPMLRDLFQADDPLTRAAVVYEFAQRALAGKPVTDEDVLTILAFSNDKNAEVRREVAHSLWKFLPRSSDGVRREMRTRLILLVRDEDEGVRATASYSLKRLEQS